MAAKRQRSEPEAKEMKFPWGTLTSVLRREVAEYAPGSMGPTARFESRLARDYQSKLCGPDRVPQVRKRPIVADQKARSISPLYCAHHPFVAPIQFNGSENPPCCLPLKLESPADWEQLFKLAELGPITMELTSPTSTQLRIFRSQKSGWDRSILELYYSNPSSFQYLIVEGGYKDALGEIAWIAYERNPENNVLTVMWPSGSTTGDELSELEWYIASDDEDKEVENQLIAELVQREWFSHDTAYAKRFVLELATMAGEYNRPGLSTALTAVAGSL